MSARTKGWAIALLYLAEPRCAAVLDTAVGVTFSSRLRVCTRHAQARKPALAFTFSAEVRRGWLTAAFVVFDCFKTARWCADRRRTGSRRQPLHEPLCTGMALRQTCIRDQAKLHSARPPALALQSATAFRKRVSAKTTGAVHAICIALSSNRTSLLLKRPTFELSGVPRYPGACPLEGMVSQHFQVPLLET